MQILRETFRDNFVMRPLGIFVSSSNNGLGSGESSSNVNQQKQWLPKLSYLKSPFLHCITLLGIHEVTSWMSDHGLGEVTLGGTRIWYPQICLQPQHASSWLMSSDNTISRSWQGCLADLLGSLYRVFRDGGWRNSFMPAPKGRCLFSRNKASRHKLCKVTILSYWINRWFYM